MTTPPLSLSSLPGQQHIGTTNTQPVSNLLEQRLDISSKAAAQSVFLATRAASLLSNGSKADPANAGVRIWSGPSADRLERSGSLMQSISESPLEQDFTVEGKPSKLGCPFASMANKKLSSHAASVLSRYNPSGSAPRTPDVEAVASTRSSVSRVNGRESFAKKIANDRRTSFADPINAEICGLDSHTVDHAQDEDNESPFSERAALKSHVSQQQEVGVCPIRFLDQHSPEEVATYFERHKHELPRSHEVCVKRYQSNEKQIRELDAKYGNLVSMIQGLGEKHQNFLPKEPDGDEVDVKDEPAEEDGRRNEKVRKWASSVSTQAGQLEDEAEEERAPHFERPLKDIRVGESPSRPWGISVPAKYLEEAAVRSEGSSSAVKVRQTELDAKQHSEPKGESKSCPFGFDKPDPSSSNVNVAQPNEKQTAPTFVKLDPNVTNATMHYDNSKPPIEGASKRMVFTGPVFIGYSAEDAAKILRDCGLARQ